MRVTTTTDRDRQRRARATELVDARWATSSHREQMIERADCILKTAEDAIEKGMDEQMPADRSRFAEIGQ